MGMDEGGAFRVLCHEQAMDALVTQLVGKPRVAPPDRTPLVAGGELHVVESGADVEAGASA